MLNLNIANDDISFKNICIKDLSKILNWYNNIDAFKYATGIDELVSIDVLLNLYQDVEDATNEFFVGIYDLDKQFIGIIKGKINVNASSSLWINTILIDPFFQSKGFGTMAVNLLVHFVKLQLLIKNVYIAVAEENVKALEFWGKLGMKRCKRLEKSVQKYKRSVFIMSKAL